MSRRDADAKAPACERLRIAASFPFKREPFPTGAAGRLSKLYPRGPELDIVLGRASFERGAPTSAALQLRTSSVPPREFGAVGLDLNRRPALYKSAALPLSYNG